MHFRNRLDRLPSCKGGMYLEAANSVVRYLVRTFAKVSDFLIVQPNVGDEVQARVFCIVTCVVGCE